ncbi:HTH domain-containing protein [Salinarchaeum sp. IM2453]|uniref:HVO_A0114 family putative DNA-binding protein n=1 Tax=Salinarchaeum sp. IM2453 TaxID=2862870 RepID=UPI001C82F1FF|nr:HTH domain-containing protein [Salinarchaeum sp. IM2453]QZA89361.1 HTH domain-containing protein [Salinarchaeum sp. IM2453]
MNNNNPRNQDNTGVQDRRVLQVQVSLTRDLDRETILPERERAENADNSIVFETTDKLREVLTPPRMEIVYALVEADQPIYIKTLAENLDRSIGSVRNDIELLSDREVIRVVKDDGIYKPYLPYDKVQVDIDFPVVKA